MLLAGTMMLGCNPKEILEPTLDYPAFVVIDGDTVKTRADKEKFLKVSKYDKVGLKKSALVGDTIVAYKEPKLNKPVKYPNVDALKNSRITELKGKSLKLIAVGGYATSGMRDGGIFNEGMLTSLPTLIANQIGVNFKNPLFDPNDYNGLGRKFITTYNPTKGPVVKQKEVVNNLAIEEGKLKKYKGDVDNYVISNAPMYSTLNENLKRLSYRKFSPSENTGTNITYLLNEKKAKFDFIIIENGLQDFFSTQNFSVGNSPEISLSELEKYKPGTDYKASGGNPTGIEADELYSSIFKLLVTQKLNNGVIINCPDLFDLPYYARSYDKELEAIKKIYYPNYIDYPGKVFGTGSVDSLLSPIVNIKLKPGITFPINLSLNEDYLEEKEFLGISSTVLSKNNKSKVFSEYAKMPIFDIYSFYKKIIRGEVVTDDGIKVSGKWPAGNFFSADGIYPSAFGHAVLANEVIKVINLYYKTDIELINTRQFLNP